MKSLKNNNKFKKKINSILNSILIDYIQYNCIIKLNRGKYINLNKWFLYQCFNIIFI